ncbi:hypothetical protein [Nonomuraea sp. bgisy101]|uniref:hypothetical protein n=1 Tax=Nonomuraea sp. bgisy101 TaxID=3413784 RepID=UPI003D71F4B1
MSLVIEADAPEEMIEAAADALGQAYRRLGHQELATRWPACVAVSIVGVAARHGGGGAFWPRWWVACRHRGSASKWGAAFLDALRAFGLRAEPDAKHSIMTHAGLGPTAEAPRLHLDPFGHGIQRDGVALPYPTKDCLLVFAEDGRHLPAELPPCPVWVAHPRDREPTADVPLRIIAEGLLPLGWDGWRLTQVDLESATWLALADGPHRPVRGQARPRLLIDRRLPGVTVPDGSAVLAVPPALRLPDGEWLVTVERAGAAPAAPADPADLWARLPRPLLGTFTVTARTAGGRAMRDTFTVAEGLAVRHDPPVRLFDEEGLMSADTLFSTEPGLTVTPQALTFSPRETVRRITCVASGQALALVVAPPHMRVLAGREWSTAPLSLTVAELEELGGLRFEIPGVREGLPVEVVSGGEGVQVLTPHARGDYPLRRVLDTVAAHGHATLVVRLDGRAIPLATISPAPQTTPDPWLCND